jgi:putative lipoic acid-binding regulatory protein
MKHDYRTLHSKLDVFHDWPGNYLFKFIVPHEKLPELERVFEGHEFTTRSSRKGRYVSLTCERHLESSDAVIEVYREVEKIDGAFAL